MRSFVLTVNLIVFTAILARAAASSIVLTPWKRVSTEFVVGRDPNDPALSTTQIVSVTKPSFGVAYVISNTVIVHGHYAYSPTSSPRTTSNSKGPVTIYKGFGIFQEDSVGLYRLKAGESIKIVDRTYSETSGINGDAAWNGSRIVCVPMNSGGASVKVSTDSGITWQSYFNPWVGAGGVKVTVTKLYFDGGVFVGSGGGTTWTSGDGVAWTKVADGDFDAIFSGQLGRFQQVPGKPGVFTLAVMREGIVKPLLTVSNYTTNVCLVANGMLAWRADTNSPGLLRLHQSDGYAVETLMPGPVHAVVPMPNGRLRAYLLETQVNPYTKAISYIYQPWDSEPLSGWTTTAPTIASIALTPRLDLTGDPNSNFTIEGAPSPEGPWRGIGEATLDENGQAVWVDPEPASRKGWFYRAAIR